MATSVAARKKLAQQALNRGVRKSKRAVAMAAQDEEESLDTASEAVMDKYHRGWAALPAYNPPCLAVDDTYQRHLTRHANK